jgi:hypothetical protein
MSKQTMRKVFQPLVLGALALALQTGPAYAVDHPLTMLEEAAGMAALAEAASESFEQTATAFGLGLEAIGSRMAASGEQAEQVEDDVQVASP